MLMLRNQEPYIPSLLCGSINYIQLQYQSHHHEYDVDYIAYYVDDLVEWLHQHLIVPDLANMNLVGGGVILPTDQL